MLWTSTHGPKDNDYWRNKDWTPNHIVPLLDVNDTDANQNQSATIEVPENQSSDRVNEEIAAVLGELEEPIPERISQHESLLI